MIKENELRLGSWVMQKTQHRIVTVPCTHEQLRLLANGGAKDLFPVVLKAELLQQCGFAENKDYALYPQAREFRLVLPVMGSGDVAILAYIKTNGESFARAMVNGVPVSNNQHHLHQVQNLYHALTGEELTIKPK